MLHGLLCDGSATWKSPAKHLKRDGWKMNFFLGMASLQGLSRTILVAGRLPISLQSQSGVLADL